MRVRHARCVQVLVLVYLAYCPLAHGLPSIAWQSAPTQGTETFVIAGDDLQLVQVQACWNGHTDNCTALPAAGFHVVEQWNASIKIGTATPWQGPAAFRLVLASDTSQVVAAAAVNEPDLWWGMALPPVSRSSLPYNPALSSNVTVVAYEGGSILRLMGRALSMDAASGTCRPSTDPTPDPDLTLRLDTSPLVSVTARQATCYDAEFLLPANLTAGRYTLQLASNWGVSRQTGLLHIVSRPSPHTVQIDVDAAFQGNLSAANQHAATLTADPNVRAQLLLSARTYNLTSTLHVANRTRLVGAGRDVTLLSLALPVTDSAQAFLLGQDDWGLSNLSIAILSAPAEFRVVQHLAGGQHFSMLDVSVAMYQYNVSNALWIEGAAGEVARCRFDQIGACLYPNYGKGSDSTNFMASNVLHMLNATDIWLHDNEIFWRCSHYDFDCSSRVIYEHNMAYATETGTVPHGNSISLYQARTYPTSQYWLFARNNISRPAFNDPWTHHNWFQRETVTSDGPGGWGTAFFGGWIDEDQQRQVRLSWTTLAEAPIPGTTLLVLAGPAVGQTRLVTSYDATANVTVLDRPLPGLASTSLLAVVASANYKAVVGNAFHWTAMAQYYGNSFFSLMADNSFANCSVSPQGAIQGVGECYHGIGQNFFIEYYNNELSDSDGIVLQDHSGPSGEPECAAYEGPWQRWIIVRRNQLAGVSWAAFSASPSNPQCGSIMRTGGSVPSLDLVVEANMVQCAYPGSLSSGNISLGQCDHCLASD